MSEIALKSGEQKKAEAAVDVFRRELGPFVTAAEKTRMPMIFTDAKAPDHPIIFANDAFLGLTGYRREEVLGKEFKSLLAEGIDGDAMATVEAEFARDSGTDPEIHYQRKDGSEFWASTFISPVRDEQGEVVQHFASLIDVAGGAERFTIRGANLQLTPKATLSLAIALHELATNAVKYGAFSNGSGTIAIGWAVTAGDSGERLLLRWIEQGGPPVTPPTHKGFGSWVIERGLAHELGGRVSLDYLPGGVACRIDVPTSAQVRA